jgi:hypothetical protein
VTVGPGDEIAAGAGGRGHLRASHADREQVIDVLTAAFVQGRLTKAEFDLRVGQVLASRAYADLDALTADIPAGPATAQPPPAPAQGHPRVGANVRARERVIMATAVFGGLAWVIAIFAGPVAWLPLLLGTGSVFVCLFWLGAWRRGQRPGGQVPPHRANIGPGPGRQVAAAGPAEQFPSGRDPGGKVGGRRPKPDSASAGGRGHLSLLSVPLACH